MRVLRISSVFETPAVTGRAAGFDPVGGLQHHAAQLCEALDDAGVEQEVVTAYRPGAPRRQQLGARTVVHRLGIPVRRLRQLYAAPAAWFVSRRDSCDVVHVHLGEDLAVLGLGLLAARRSGAPLVVTVHCSPTHTLTPSGLRSAVLHHLGGWLERRVLTRLAAAVITLTDRTADRLASDGVERDRVHVLPSGVDHRRFGGAPDDPTPAVGRPRIAYVGRLAHQKGVDVLVDAVAALPAAPPLVIVGDGPLRPQVEERVRRAGIQHRVHLVGFVPHRDVPRHLAHADVLVLPSRYEELGSVLVEAAFAGVPVVASRVGGIPEVVDDGCTGLLVPPGDATALAAAIDALVADPCRRRRMGEQAALAAEDHRWDRLAARTLDVYRSVLGP